MNLETFLNNCIDIIYSNPENVSISYSNIDGKESLIINGKEMIKQFDDSKIKKEIENYKNNLDLLDDCLFMEVAESMGDDMNLKEMEDLLSQKSFTQAEANLAYDLMNMVNMKIKEKIIEKINELEDLSTRF